MGAEEFWGPHARVDPLIDLFTHLHMDNHLVDVELVNMTQNWRNKRVGEARVEKNLDLFLHV